ncbi:unnamed protein product [Prorocentrum cordatum]|uniref:EF-hand domain-containing protein n=1 Tax=Prorocentrum cordatum TaxID=2364126 RepID=A0ABN9XKP7_9DINO|nr:unnamed protein product [Polarella glacialis]
MPDGAPNDAASAPPRSLAIGERAPPSLDGGDFRALLEQAGAAHDAEVERLRLEARALWRELLAARQRLGGDLVCGEDLAARGASLACSGGLACSGDALPERRSGSEDASLERRSDGGCREMRNGLGTASQTTALSSQSHLTGQSLQAKAPAGLMSRNRPIRENEIARRGRLWGLVTAPAFEAAVSVVIILNSVTLALEAQYNSFSLATRIGHRSAAGESAEVWPLGEDFFLVLSWAFGLIFTLELAAKIAGLRLDFFKDPWNWLDAVIVIVWLISASTPITLNVQVLRVARIARVIRLVRILKFMKGAHSDGLFMMTTALSGSLWTTGWCFLFLLVLHCVLALAFYQIIYETYFNNNSSTAQEEAQMYEYFGSFSRTFLTMFEITFGNFIAPIRILVECVDEGFVVYAVVHKIVLGFAVIGVLNAVFIQETFKVAQLDDNLMVRQQRRKAEHHTKKMQALFREADTDGNGTLDLDEWMTICQDEWVMMWLSCQDIKVDEAQDLFQMIDDGDGRLTAEEVVKGTASLRGTSAMMKLLSTARGIKNSVSDIRAELLFSQLPVAAERM